MVDIAPELYEAILNDFKTSIEHNFSLQFAAKQLETGGYAAAQMFAQEVGKVAADVLQRNLLSGVLPDGKLYFNIAERTITPLLKEMYNLDANACETVQNAINKRAGNALKAVRPEFNTDRAEGLIEALTYPERLEDAAALLRSAPVNFSQSVVDDSVKANADFYNQSGLTCYISRVAVGGCCKWCAKLGGKYRYPQDTPRDVFRRHENCNCGVFFVDGGKVQNSHTKVMIDTEAVNARKSLNASVNTAENKQGKALELFLAEFYKK